MALLNDQGQPIADRWQVATEGEAVTSPETILPLARFLAARAGTPEIAGDELARGVALGADARPERLREVLDRIDLVAIDFPKFRDGRGFTIARTLREHMGYEGEIRARGHVLPDQFVMLLDCGFTTVEAPEDRPIARWAEFLVLQPHGPEPARPVQLFRRLVSGRA